MTFVARPEPVLRDSFGRVATDLRISLTDKCSLRCTYCMPAEGLDWLTRTERLSDDEIVRLAEVFVGLGVTSVRLTGGEPLVHRSVVDVVSRLAALEPRPELSLTTNGISLDRFAAPLLAAGLDRVNISLDTLDPARFKELTRRDRLADVLDGIAAAAAAGLRPVKINTVLMRDSQPRRGAGAAAVGAAVGLPVALHRAHAARRRPHLVADDDGHRRRDPRTARRTTSSSSRAGTTATRRPRSSTWSTARSATVGRPVPARVGIIASVTRPFCRDCDRLRLTADGQLRTCLFAHGETDLRGPLRAGASDAELAELIRTAVAGKQAGHGIDAADFVQPDAHHVGHRRLTLIRRRIPMRRSVRLRSDAQAVGRRRGRAGSRATARKSARWSAWSSQASQCLTRAASCSSGCASAGRSWRRRGSPSPSSAAASGVLV